MLAFVVALLASLAKEVGVATFALFVAFDVVDVVCASPTVMKAGKRLARSKRAGLNSVPHRNSLLSALSEAPGVRRQEPSLIE